MVQVCVQDRHSRCSIRLVDCSTCCGLVSHMNLWAQRLCSQPCKGEPTELLADRVSVKGHEDRRHPSKGSLPISQPSTKVTMFKTQDEVACPYCTGSESDRDNSNVDKLTDEPDYLLNRAPSCACSTIGT